MKFIKLTILKWIEITIFVIPTLGDLDYDENVAQVIQITFKCYRSLRNKKLLLVILKQLLPDPLKVKNIMVWKYSQTD